jgi:hypothetical protein
MSASQPSRFGVAAPGIRLQGDPVTEPSHLQSAAATKAPQQAPSSPLLSGASTVNVGASETMASRDRVGRLRRLLSQPGRRAMWAIVGFLIASLFVPAATKQWSDRSSELQLKRDLISDITRFTTDTVLAAECVATQCTYDYLVQQDSTGDAWLEATAELYRLNREANSEWFTSTQEMDVLLRTYFPESDLVAEWASFSDTVSAYLRIGTGECGAAREADMNLLRAELPAVQENTWTDLIRGIGSDCQLTPPHWPPAYSNVADAVLQHRQSLTDQIVQANAIGYSSGWRDFVDDLYPL